MSIKKLYCIRDSKSDQEIIFEDYSKALNHILNSGKLSLKITIKVVNL